MKTRSCVLVMSLLAMFHVSVGQSGVNGARPDGLALKGGLALSTIGFDNEDAETHADRFRVGPLIGLSYEIPMPDFFTFEAELLYDLRGTREEIDFLNGDEWIIKNYLHYLHIPGSFKFYIGDHFNINFGPYMAILMAGKAKRAVYNSNGTELTSERYSLTGEGAEDIFGNTYLKRIDAGLQGGLEFVSASGVGVGTRFSKGLVDISHDDHLLGGGNARTTEVNIYVNFRLNTAE